MPGFEAQRVTMGGAAGRWDLRLTSREIAIQENEGERLRSLKVRPDSSSQP